MQKTLLTIATSSLMSLPVIAQADSPLFSMQDGDGFKRFSVSMGALHVMPQGKAQPIRVNTAVQDGEVADVGDISIDSVKSNLDPEMDANLSSTFVDLLDTLNVDTLPAALSGTAEIYGLEQWDNPNTGLEADDVTTLGILSNYHFTDNVSFEVKAGIPPKVDINGKGKIYAPFSAQATPELIGIDLPQIDLKNDILITDLEAYGPVASARAWTPAFEFQYHFGKTGVNKFRPYVGLGVMYAYFNELELNDQTEKDLIDAGHMIANIKAGQAGASLDRLDSPANPKVSLESEDAIAPVATIGFTYDFNDKWFAVGSVSYAHLTTESTITVSDEEYGQLIKSTSDIEINPLLAYAGIGMRF